MGELDFEWNERKAEANVAKHGISFDEAVTVFYDDNARVIFDPDNSLEEDRYLILGMSEASQLLLVCHVYRRNDEVIRVISARRATSREERQYWSFIP
ncbi:BrnT family toxin [Nodosilinea sp. PGN35]|uniref:BrnT family toxin n=1 Tax=Nodosilinea sp. PGN35 TaxID=3020489 RepID=UPI0023B2F775|nr:BrnT family toxin [Nodosilinea sp. TSF1-S3]MDF0366262.1 BrnT family toxin [Nodosilinea sp. TSF1-S3]